MGACVGGGEGNVKDEGEPDEAEGKGAETAAAKGFTEEVGSEEGGEQGVEAGADHGPIRSRSDFEGCKDQTVVDGASCEAHPDGNGAIAPLGPPRMRFTQAEQHREHHPRASETQEPDHHGCGLSDGNLAEQEEATPQEGDQQHAPGSPQLRITDGCRWGENDGNLRVQGESP